MPFTPEDAYWVSLFCAPGLPPEYGRPLTPRLWHEVREARQKKPALSLADLKEGALEAGISPGTAERIDGLARKRSPVFAEFLEQWQEKGIHLIAEGELDFPEELAHYYGPRMVPVLFARGSRNLLVPKNRLALVGAREARADALRWARELGQKAVEEKLPLVSGCARGIDQAAMAGAASAGGPVIGVSAEGLGPTFDRNPWRRLLDGGKLLLLTPFSPDSVFSSGLAMARNHMIYALARWGLIVQAHYGQGGSWKGALNAWGRQARPLFVRDAQDIPGNQGLLRQGLLPFPEEIPASVLTFLEKGEKDWQKNHPPRDGHQQMELFP